MLKKISAVFYKNSSGNEPVRQWLISLSKEERRIIGEDIKTVEFGYPVGMPLCKPLGEGLYEVRSNLNKKISRVIFFVHENNMYLLHGFIKKTQKTEKKDLDIAILRMKEIKQWI